MKAAAIQVEVKYVTVLLRARNGFGETLVPKWDSDVEQGIIKDRHRYDPACSFPQR